MAPPPYLCISQPIHPTTSSDNSFLSTFSPSQLPSSIVCIFDLPTRISYRDYLRYKSSNNWREAGRVRVGSSFVSQDFADINTCWIGRVQLFRRDNQSFQMPKEHLSLGRPPELRGSRRAVRNNVRGWAGRGAGWGGEQKARPAGPPSS